MDIDRSGLADFLRQRREALQPEDVGLPRGQRRRTTGLRREEVAMLAGMSVDYVVRLEQGRSSQPSTQLLGALARALRLSEDERTHLFHLAGHQPPPADGTRTPRVTSATAASPVRVAVSTCPSPRRVVDSLRRTA